MPLDDALAEDSWRHGNSYNMLTIRSLQGAEALKAAVQLRQSFIVVESDCHAIEATDVHRPSDDTEHVAEHFAKRLRLVMIGEAPQTNLKIRWHSGFSLKERVPCIVYSVSHRPRFHHFHDTCYHSTCSFWNGAILPSCMP